MHRIAVLVLFVLFAACSQEPAPDPGMTASAGAPAIASTPAQAALNFGPWNTRRTANRNPANGGSPRSAPLHQIVPARLGLVLDLRDQEVSLTSSLGELHDLSDAPAEKREPSQR